MLMCLPSLRVQALAMMQMLPNKSDVASPAHTVGALKTYLATTSYTNTHISASTRKLPSFPALTLMLSRTDKTRRIF